MTKAFWLQTANQNACEIARLAGFGMVVFDAEHGEGDELTATMIGFKSLFAQQ